MLLLLLATLGLVTDTQAKQFLVETGNTTILHDDEPNKNIGGQRLKEAAGSDYSLSSGSLIEPNKVLAKTSSPGERKCFSCLYVRGFLLSIILHYKMFNYLFWLSVLSIFCVLLSWFLVVPLTDIYNKL